MTLRWDCKRQGCYRNILPDWSMLDGCFGRTKVSACDVDGEVHQNGKFLILEKKFPAGFLDARSLRSFRSKVEQGNTGIAFWCEKPNGEDITAMRVFGLPGYNSEVRVAATLADFRDAVRAWWKIVYEPGKM